MRLPDVLDTTAIRHWQTHTLNVPPLCPKSRNPRPGSTITIGHWTGKLVLEAADLLRYIYEFEDGLWDEQGELIIRSMEEMVSRVYLDCREALGTAVAVVADWIVLPRQEVHMVFDPDRIWPQGGAQ